MEILNGLSDDQTALFGCAAALMVCGTIMSLSYYVGRFFHKTHQSPEPNEPQTLRMPAPLAIGPRNLSSSAPEATARRAA